MLDNFLDTLAEWLGIKQKPVLIPVRHNNNRPEDGRRNKRKTK